MYESVPENTYARNFENTSATAMELEVMPTARMTLTRSPPGSTVEDWLLIPNLNIIQQAVYFP